MPSRVSTVSGDQSVEELRCELAEARERTIHVADVMAESGEYPESLKNALQQGYRTSLGVPLVHAGQAIGAFLIRRAEVTPFNERQIELVSTFADQAVIAIENARLFEAEQTGKRELQESLEYQTATSDVLGVISRSAFELQPVLEAVVESATRLWVKRHLPFVCWGEAAIGQMTK